MDPSKPPNQIYGLPYSKVEYPVGMQPNVIAGTQAGIAPGTNSQLQYSNMLQMMYNSQNVLPLGLPAQLYQYHPALAGLNVFPTQFAGQVGQTGGALLQQGSFQGFNPAAMGFGTYSYMPATAGVAGVPPTSKETGGTQTPGQAPTASAAGSQTSRAREETNDKDQRHRSRDRDHNKKQKDQGKPREKDLQSREPAGRQSDGPGRQTPNQRGLSDSRHHQHQQPQKHQQGNGQDRQGNERRHREDRESREREKSLMRDGRDRPGFGGFGQQHGGQLQNTRRDDDRDHYRREKDFRNYQGPQRHDHDRFRDQGPHRDRDRDQRRDFERDRPAGDSWKNKDRQQDKPKDRERERERDRDRDRERDRDRFSRDNRNERFEGRDTAEKESGSLGFREITKPMDNIEGNTIPKDRPVSYMCIESNVARKAVVIEMVKFKIGKYFLEDKAVQARQAAEGDEEAAVEADPERECAADDDELGLSDEEDLYHLTFRKRYYNDSEICGACFKEGKTPLTVGHTEKSCPERFRSVCWMCLGNHNKDECVNIACFRCNGSGHKNSNCPMRDSNNIPFCQKCKKRSHLERDCSMLNLSFSRIIQEKDTHAQMLCTYCGQRGHLPSMHFKNEMMDIEEQTKEAEEHVDVLHHTNSKSAADAEPQLDWQNAIHSDDGEEDALPSLYEPKESMQRENSTVLRMLSRESAEKQNPPAPEA